MELEWSLKVLWNHLFYYFHQVYLIQTELKIFRNNPKNTGKYFEEYQQHSEGCSQNIDKFILLLGMVCFLEYAS